MSPRDLVCARCWRDFFNTEAYEQCCTFGHTKTSQQLSIESVAKVKEIREEADCSWCAYIRTFVNNSWGPEDPVTVSLIPSQIESCTPKGSNVFHLSIDCYSPDDKWVGGSALFLHAFTEQDGVAAEYVTARPVRTDVNSEAAKSQLRTWNADCVNHVECMSVHKPTTLPTRVIEISPPGRQGPRLLESNGSEGVYATLSYCWGPEPFHTLTTSNYGSFIEDLDPQSLPQTIRDAITVTRSLSIPYLWVDALCILQDNEGDKLRELASMKNVYERSTLTIVAASTTNVSEGFLHPRTHTEICHRIPFRFGAGIFGTISVNELDAISYDERMEPIAKRAWTLQEQILTWRTLAFTTHTMMWRCPAGTRTFGDSLYFPHDLDAGYNENDEKYSLNFHSLLTDPFKQNISSDKLLSCWLRIVTAYSLRTASFEEDKLNAIAGIAAHPFFSNQLGSDYLAGLWVYKLARQLVWRASDSHRTLPEEGVVVRRPLKYRAPSWSWASVEGGVIYFDFTFDDVDETEPEVVCDILSCVSTLKSDYHSFGEVSSGLLRVKAPARSAWFDPSTKSIYLLPASSGDESIRTALHNSSFVGLDEAARRHVEDFQITYPDVDLKEDDEATHGTDHRNMCGKHDETGEFEPVIVLCVAVTDEPGNTGGLTGLLLVASEGDGEKFRRIGCFERGRSEEFQGPKVEMEIV